ncbi:uncharacterized protein [Pleurodeles waltl]|uniref:uncharacterized protein isoform X2 n=1 Tax=Pleurodeles waltl TaxID=8319 RepID=UPI003709969A
MPSKSPEYAQVHRTAVLKEVCYAGQFEHVAQMNVFQDQLLPVKIPVKLFYTKNTSEDANCSGPGDAEKRHGSKSADAHDRTSDISKLVNELRVDLDLCDSEEISEDEDQDINTARSRNGRAHFGTTQAPRGKPFNKRHKTSEAAQSRDDLEWQTAREKIEEFLDFPAVASGKAFRTLKELTSYSDREDFEKTEYRSPPCMPMALQSSRPTAVFLHESQKSLQHLTSQEATFLENTSIVNSPQIGSSQRENLTPVFQTPVNTSQQPNLHHLPVAEHHVNETKSHSPQSAQVSNESNDQNAVILEKIQRSLMILMEQKKRALEPESRTISPTFQGDNESSNNKSPGEERASMSASDASQEEQRKPDGRAPVLRPRTLLNVAPGSTSQSKL